MNITVTDKEGREVADAMNLIQFSATETCKIIGVGNGDPSSHEADKYFNSGAVFIHCKEQWVAGNDSRYWNKKSSR